MCIDPLKGSSLITSTDKQPAAGQLAVPAGLLGLKLKPSSHKSCGFIFLLYSVTEGGVMLGDMKTKKSFAGEFAHVKKVIKLLNIVV